MPRALIVHLSDIHIRSTEEPILMRTNQIASAIGSVGRDASRCVLVLTGDVANSGEESQYRAALDFIEGVRTNLGSYLRVEAIDVVLLPGNHDCELKPENKSRTKLISLLAANPEDALDPSITEICTKAQANFFDFMSLYGTPENVRHNNLYYEYRFDLEGTTVLFRCINTAWVSQLHEHQGALVYPVDAIWSEQDAAAAAVVSVMHHPYNWLRNDNARALRNKVEAISDIVLTGHEHVDANYIKYAPHGARNAYFEGGVLNDPTDSTSSKFTVIEIDLTKKLQRTTSFAWQSDIYSPTEATTPWSKFQINELRTQREFSPNPSYEAELSDPGASFTSSYGLLSLEDIFIYPMLQEQTEPVRREGTFRASELVDRLRSDHRIIIDGATNAGKTALAKVLYRDLISAGLTPVLLDGGEISDYRSQRIRNALHRAFAAQYRPDLLEKYKQLPADKKVILVDDFGQVRLNAQGRAQLTRELSREATYVVLLSNDLAMQLEEITNRGPDDPLRSFASLRLLEFGYKLRDEMVNKWLRPHEDYESSAAEIAHRVKHAQDVLDAVLGRNFIPSYPVFILTVLQLLEANTQLDTSAPSLGYGYFYEALVQSQLDKVAPELDPSTRLTYLSELAYYMFKARRRQIDLEEVHAVHDGYCADYRRPLDFEKTLAAFESAIILQLTNQSVRFKYGYIYYYFVASYVRDHISEAGIRSDIEEMSDRVYKEEYANILLFLTHLSKDRFIIDQVLNKSRDLYPNVTPANLEDDVEFLNELYDNVPRLVYEEKDPETVRNELAQELDETSDLSGEEKLEDDLTEKEEEDLRSILEINKGYKTIQILGQILKNSPGAIKGDRKLEIAEETYGLGRRLLARQYKLVEENLEPIVQDLVARVEERHPEALHDEVVSGVRKLLFHLTQVLGFGMIKWITRSIGSEKLAETYKDLLGNDASVATALIDTSLKLDHVGKYPLRDLVDLEKRLHSNLYSRSLLQLLILYHMDLFYVPRDMKQRMCEIVDIQYSPIPSQRAIERTGPGSSVQ